MLPAAVCRDIYGPRKRRATDFTSPDAQLVGRSRSERLLDGIFNRHSRQLRSETLQRRRRELKIRLAKREAAKRATLDKESKVHPAKRQKTEQVVKRSTAANSLVKHVSNKPKFAKVVSLAQQLIDSSSAPAEQETLLNLLISFALSPHCASDSVCRPAVIKLFESISAKLLDHSESASNSKGRLPDTVVDDIPPGLDPDSLSEFLDSPMSLEGWVAILCIPGVLHVKLFTDDTFQFNSALSQISKRIEQLPPLDAVLGSSDQMPSLEEFLTALQDRCQVEMKKEMKKEEMKKEEVKKEEVIEVKEEEIIEEKGVEDIGKSDGVECPKIMSQCVECPNISSNESSVVTRDEEDDNNMDPSDDEEEEELSIPTR